MNGADQRGLARLGLASGSRVASFRAKINWGDVRALAARGARLYAGGTFSAINGVHRAALARLNAGTGAVDTGFDARLTAPGLSRTRVEHFDVSPDGRRLVAVGALLRSGGHDRTQIALFDVGGAAAALADWYTDAYKPQCMQGFDTYLRQVKFSPDGSYFVVAATGRASSPTKLCDSAARFEVGRHRPAQPDLGAAHRRRLALRGGGHRRGRLRRRPPALPGQPVRHRRQRPRAGRGGPGRHRRGEPEPPARRWPGTRPGPAASACAPSWSPATACSSAPTPTSWARSTTAASACSR